MKNIDYAIRKLINEKGLQGKEDEVREVIMTYWREFYSKIYGGNDTCITLRHIGSFVVSRYKLNKLIKFIISRIRLVRVDPRWDTGREEALEMLYRRFRKCCERRNEVATHFYISWKKKNEKIRRKKESQLK